MSSINIVPWNTWWYVINGEDVHEAQTHAEALAIRDALLDDIQRAKWEGGIEYEVVDADEVSLSPLGY